MTTTRCARNALVILIWSLMAVVVSEQAMAQGCKPASERIGDQKGCWIFVVEPLGQLPPKPLFWHLVNYPTRAEAEMAKGPRGTVIDAFDKIWLSTIAETGWQAPGGVRVAEIGPLPGILNVPYTAVYMESGNTPGISSNVHRHGGSEVFYTLVGDLCLETPDGIQTGHAGESTIAAPGVPMKLTTVGTERRRSLVLILHETAKPRGTPAPDWTPKGLCTP
jgi:quercetin dioxygenase-like cupin family protein